MSLSSNACSLALSQAAGLKLQMECNAYIQRRGSQVPTWDFVITSGGNLDCQFVFHCVCQDYTEKVSGLEVEHKILHRL